MTLERVWNHKPGERQKRFSCPVAQRPEVRRKSVWTKMHGDESYLWAVAQPVASSCYQLINVSGTRDPAPSRATGEAFRYDLLGLEDIYIIAKS